MEARIRMFGVTKFQDVQKVLSHYPTVGSQDTNGWTLEYNYIDTDSSAIQSSLDSSLLDVDLFIRATYEIQDLAKLSNESIHGLPPLSAAHIFFQKSLCYCYHATTVLGHHTAHDSRFAKSVSDAETILRSVVTSLGLGPSLAVLHVSLQGIRTRYHQDIRTLVRLAFPNITACSRLGSGLLLARAMSNGLERYVFVSLRDDYCLLDDVSPYQLLLARYAGQDIMNLYTNFCADLNSYVDLPSEKAVRDSSGLLRLAEARERLVKKSSEMQKLQAKHSILSLFISRAPLFNPPIAEELLVTARPKVLQSVHEEFGRFYQHPLSILSTHAEAIIHEGTQQLTTLVELASLRVNLRIQRQITLLTILGIFVAIVTLVVTS